MKSAGWVAVTGVGVVTPGGDDPLTARSDDPAPGSWFDASSRLGRRGYRYLPPAAQYLLAAARRAVPEAGFADVPAARRAVAVGSNNGAAALLAGMDQTLVEQDADHLSPATAPFFAVNVLASRLCAEHDLKGFSLTLTSPLVAGLEGVEIGGRALTVGRADVVLAAATEERLSEDAPRADQSDQGAVVLVLQQVAAGAAAPPGTLGGCRVRTAFVPPGLVQEPVGARQAGRTITSLVRAVTGSERPDLAVHLVTDESAVAEAVVAAVGRDSVSSVQRSGVGCVAPMLRLARELCDRSRGDRDAGSLLLTADEGGNLAAAYVRPGPGAFHELRE
ncbi:beta-ketoacyl synthase N-terminal-like domain-containing protein [Micromonospora sp. NPDC049230]|uniref:beta-ketoacyl synthase N-terminal-like domain-containing protein n=1 Tax=Micromonospora sp. NPDC049230 TaxID=3155502 RepID=UPI0034036C17